MQRLMYQTIPKMPHFYSLSDECQAIAKINSISKLINEHVAPQQYIKNHEQLRINLKINQQKLIEETLKYHWRHWITYVIPFWKTKQKKKINKLLHNCYNLLYQLSDTQHNREIIQQLYGMVMTASTQTPAEPKRNEDKYNQACLLIKIKFKQKQIENIIHSIGITIVNQQDIITDDIEIEDANPIINQIQQCVNHIHQMLKSNPNICIPQTIKISQNTTKAFLNQALNELQQIENHLSSTIINNISRSHITLNSNNTCEDVNQ